MASGASQDDVWSRLGAILTQSEDKALDDLVCTYPSISSLRYVQLIDANFSKRSTYLNKNSNPNIPPEVLALWAKICVSTDALRELVREFESWEAKSNVSRGQGKFSFQRRVPACSCSLARQVVD